MIEPFVRHWSEDNGEGPGRRSPLAPNVDSVGHPNLVRRLHVELPIQGVVDDDRRLAAKLAGTALVADLRLDASQLGEPGDTVRADAFALLEEVVMQLAITVDLA